MMMMMMMTTTMSYAGVTGEVNASLRNMSIPAGSDITLNCSSRNIYWNFVQTNASTPPQLICYKGVSMSENNRKYRCQKNSAGYWTVVVTKFGQSDVGLYTCSDGRNNRDSSLLSLACRFTCIHSL